MDSRQKNEWLELQNARNGEPEYGDAALSDSDRAELEASGLADAMIRAALLDVPVPADLQSRLLQRLSASNRVEPVAVKTGRRRWLKAACASALVVGAAFTALGLRELAKPQWDLDSVREEAIVLYRDLEGQPVEYPKQRAVDFPLAVGFSSFAYVGVHQPRFLDIQTNAYEFQRGTSRAVVFALPRERFERKRISLPEQEGSTIGGLFVTIWPTDDWVYVAVYAREQDLALFTAGRSLTLR